MPCAIPACSILSETLHLVLWNVIRVIQKGRVDRVGLLVKSDCIHSDIGNRSWRWWRRARRGQVANPLWLPEVGRLSQITWSAKFAGSIAFSFENWNRRRQYAIYLPYLTHITHPTNFFLNYTPLILNICHQGARHSPPPIVSHNTRVKSKKKKPSVVKYQSSTKSNFSTWCRAYWEGLGAM